MWYEAKHFQNTEGIMTKREIEKLLRKAGFECRSGGRHDIWVKPDYPPIPVPRQGMSLV